MKLINNPSSAYATFKVNLDGEIFTLVQRYNTRTTSWYLDVTDSSGESLVLGKKLQLYMPVVTKNLSSMADGNLTVVQVTDGTETEIGRDNFGASLDYRLVYYTSEDLE